MRTFSPAPSPARTISESAGRLPPRPVGSSRLPLGLRPSSAYEYPREPLLPKPHGGQSSRGVQTPTRRGLRLRTKKRTAARDSAELQLPEDLATARVDTPFRPPWVLVVSRGVGGGVSDLGPAHQAYFLVAGRGW
jgi:hypothetical protein